MLHPPPGTLLSLEQARRRVAEYVRRFNEERIDGAIGHVTPADKLAGRDLAIFAERGRKLEAARERRRRAPRGESAGRVTLVKAIAAGSLYFYDGS